VIQVKFENLEIHMPHDKFEAVFSTTLNNLGMDIQKILTDEKERMELLKKAEFFVKKCYNIPEDNPKDMLGKILSEKD